MQTFESVGLAAAHARQRKGTALYDPLIGRTSASSVEPAKNSAKWFIPVWVGLWIGDHRLRSSL
jgi:hypothetical protein